MTEFEDIVGTEGLAPDEEERLRRVHELLLAAGPPPDLPPELARPADPNAAQPPEVPLLFRRRRAVAAVALIAAAIAVFAGGYAAGHSHSKQEAFVSRRDVSMHGAAGRAAVIHIGKKDAAGNWPMLVDASGLPQQQSRAAYYELWLTKNGKPAVPCGSFRMHGHTTSVRLSVPYSLRGFDGWVVTAQANEETLGPVVLTT
ncbi:MAG TPA: anti-sigma factor [Gaiellaceae bacterium]|nr:anti-sigma factor [Gaiellaceae bacterium]